MEFPASLKPPPWGAVNGAVAISDTDETNSAVVSACAEKLGQPS